MGKFMTQLERYQKTRGEPLYALAARLGLSVTIIYKMTGRNYQPRKDGEFSIGYPALKTVSNDTGIPTDVLFTEAEKAALAPPEKDDKVYGQH